jgi:hypothetical protein
MTVSDEELLVASVGDEEAFAAFYRRHARPLAGFFMRRTGDGELAADLTAETFAAALASRRAGALTPPRVRRSAGCTGSRGTSSRGRWSTGASRTAPAARSAWRRSRSTTRRSSS